MYNQTHMERMFPSGLIQILIFLNSFFQFFYWDDSKLRCANSKFGTEKSSNVFLAKLAPKQLND